MGEGMKVIDPGHEYRLDFLDGKGLQCTVYLSGERHVVRNDTLTFVKREGEGYPGNVGHHAGTIIQEVLRVLIDRLKYVDNQIPCAETKNAMEDLRSAIIWLERRAAGRHGREVSFTSEVELQSTCPKCLHIGCEGGCHR